MKKEVLLFIYFICSVSIAQDWETNYDKALEIAQINNKKIVLVFQGSDWCAPCIKLERNVWSSPEFMNYAKSHFVMLKADFPKRKKNKLSKEQQSHNNKLAERFNKNGYFPFVIVLDNNGTVLGTTAYKKIPVSEYIEQLENF